MVGLLVLRLLRMPKCACRDQGRELAMFTDQCARAFQSLSLEVWSAISTNLQPSVRWTKRLFPAGFG